MTSLVLSKSELRELCDTGKKDQQIEQLIAWDIPFKTSITTGDIKVLRSELRFQADTKKQEEPNYDAARIPKRVARDSGS